MCRITQITRLEDCLDGSRVRQYTLDAPLDESIMKRLAEGSVLDFYPQFPRPYFRIRRRGAYVIQGVIGKNSFRVTFDHAACKEAETILRTQVERNAISWAQNSCNTTPSPTSEAACR